MHSRASRRLQGGGAAAGTDFSQWSDTELRGFLDQRGEDFDDCEDRAALVRQPCYDKKSLPMLFFYTWSCMP